MIRFIIFWPMFAMDCTPPGTYKDTSVEKKEKNIIIIKIYNII
jgi:hypothetical protein